MYQTLRDNQASSKEAVERFSIIKKPVEVKRNLLKIYLYIYNVSFHSDKAGKRWWKLNKIG